MVGFKFIGLGVLFFLVHINILGASQNEFNKIHVYSENNPTVQLDIIVDTKTKMIFINKMDFKGPVATGDLTHKISKPIEVKINNLIKKNDQIIVEAGYSFEEGLSMKITIDLLLDETTNKPINASIKLTSSLEEISVKWVPSLLKFKFVN